jgi:sigma-B regulation protein RsbU (phosphoserine phosphatase)
MFIGVMSPDGLMHWTSGGHGPVLFQRAGGAPVEFLDPPGPPVGVLDAFLGEQTEPIRFDPGGRIMVVSDGLFEAFNPSGEQLGIEAISQVATRAIGPPTDVIAAMKSLVLAWQQNDEPKDDQTVVVVQRE